MACNSRRVPPVNAGLMVFLGGAVANSTGARVSASTLTRAAFFVLACYLGATAGLALAAQPEIISVLWLANPVTVAVVLFSPPFMGPAILLALYSGPLWAALRFGPRGAAG